MPAREEAMVSIVIPTFRRRTALLARTLGYYASVSCPFPILVSDSGDADAQEANAALIGEHGSSLRARHFRYPADQDIFAKLADALDSVDTPYAVVCGDDDFLVPDAVRQCAEYLQARADVAAVDGREVKLSLITTRGEEDQPRVAIHPQLSIESERAVERLEWHFSHYWPTFYCVQRRGALARNMRIAGEHGANSLFGELMQSGLTIIGGKYHHLETLYLARHVLHAELHMPLWHEAAKTETFKAQTDAFCRRLAEELGPDAGPLDERERRVRDAFRRFLKPLTRRRPAALERVGPALSMVPRAARQALFGGKLRAAVTSPRRFLAACWADRREEQQGEWALSQLRRAQSPHFEAFGAIFEWFQRWPTGVPANARAGANQPGASTADAEP